MSTASDPSARGAVGAAGGDGLSQLLRMGRAVRDRWYVVLLVAVPVVAGAVWYAQQLPATYSSEAIVLVEPRPGDTAVSPGVVTLKSPSYVAYLTAPATLRDLADRLDMQVSEVGPALDAQVEQDTGNITVSATASDPGRAQRIAQEGADLLVEFSDRDELLQAGLLAPAIEPTSPSGPPRRTIEAAAAVVALALAVAAALAVDRRRPRVDGPADVESLTGWSLLGRVPARPRLPESPSLAFADPSVGTAIRSLRVRLEPDLRRGAALTVTSALPGEGKSTVSALLATALARSGFATALVDGDLRHPRLGSWIDAWDGPGLAEVVAGSASIDDALVPGWTDKLLLLPTREDADVGEGLSVRLPDVLVELGERVDVVIVDAPPLLTSDEARAFASGTDRVAMVVATGTTWDALAEADTTLAGLRADVVGYVLNRTARRRRVEG